MIFKLSSTVCRFSKFDASKGASGTGRTTFVNTLCESEVLPHKISDNPDTAHVEEGIRIKPVNVGTSGVFSRPKSLDLTVLRRR